MASDTFPPGKGRNKVILEPGFGLSDWMNMQRQMIPLGGRKKVSNAELLEHSSEADCWTALNGKVYNITHYLRYHPGGVAKLMLAAGKDGTDLFNKYHQWVNIDSILGKCCVGTLLTPQEEEALAEWEAEQQAKEAAEAAEAEAAAAAAQAALAADSEAQINNNNSSTSSSAEDSRTQTPPPAAQPQRRKSLSSPRVIATDEAVDDTIFTTLITEHTSGLHLSQHLESDSSAAAQSLLASSPPVRTSIGSSKSGVVVRASSKANMIDPNAVIFSGELTKEGHAFKTWKSRWFELRYFELKYFDRNKEPRTAKGHFMLSGATLHPNKGNKMFSLESPGGKVLLMKAATEELKAEWIEAISAQLAMINTPNTAAVAGAGAGAGVVPLGGYPAAHTPPPGMASCRSVGDYESGDEDETAGTPAAVGGFVAVPPPTEAQIEQAVLPGPETESVVIACGTLSKRGQVNTSWKSRYFELQPSFIKYFEKTDENKALKGAFHLVNATLLSDPNSNEFMLTSTAGLSLVIKADTPSSKNNWIKAISIQIAAVSR